MSRSWVLRVVVAVVGFSCVAATCEPPRTVAPLSDVASAKADARLAGTWAGRTGDDAAAFTLTVVPHEASPLMDLVLIGDDGKKGAAVLVFEAFASVVGGRSYLNLRPKRFTDEYAATSVVSERYLLARYEVTKASELSLWVVTSDEAARKAVGAGKTTGMELDGGMYVLTAPTPALAEFISKTPEGAALFEPWATLKRVKVEAAKATKPK